MIYMVVRLFGVIVAVAGPVPYTLDECVESLHVLRLPVELQATAECIAADALPERGSLSAEQLEAVQAWVERQESDAH